MRIQCVEIANFRRLNLTHIDFDRKTTIFVGANNSGKTSAMTALRYFLVSPKSLVIRDITMSNWAVIDSIGLAWEKKEIPQIDLEGLLPSLDIWLDVPLTQIRHVVHILPTLDWRGGSIGVRLQYRVVNLERLKVEYLVQREASIAASKKNSGDGEKPLEMWPLSLTEYLGKELSRHVTLRSFPLDPAGKKNPKKGVAAPQVLPDDSQPLDNNPFAKIIKIHEIAAQRDFADAGTKNFDSDTEDGESRRYKRRLSEQLRTYYDRHLDPSKTPSDKDYEALYAMQRAEHSFDARLEEGFGPAMNELESIGYPGISNPRLKITTKMRAVDGMRHNSALQYEVTQPSHSGAPALKLPEDYSGLGSPLAGQIPPLLATPNSPTR